MLHWISATVNNTKSTTTSRLSPEQDDKDGKERLDDDEDKNDEAVAVGPGVGAGAGSDQSQQAKEEDDCS